MWPLTKDQTSSLARTICSKISRHETMKPLRSISQSCKGLHLLNAIVRKYWTNYRHPRLNDHSGSAEMYGRNPIPRAKCSISCGNLFLLKGREEENAGCGVNRWIFFVTFCSFKTSHGEREGESQRHLEIGQIRFGDDSIFKCEWLNTQGTETNN